MGEREERGGGWVVFCSSQVGPPRRLDALAPVNKKRGNKEEEEEETRRTGEESEYFSRCKWHKLHTHWEASSCATKN